MFATDQLQLSCRVHCLAHRSRSLLCTRFAVLYRSSKAISIMMCNIKLLQLHAIWTGIAIVWHHQTAARCLRSVRHSLCRERGLFVGDRGKRRG